ncbi:MAG: APC family permease [Bacteroidetes bacterium]|nr:MAG: APC family permease [Bacteroidota bacterium]
MCFLYFKGEKKRVKLGELSATAICGNDISSSVLYVSALSIGFAGRYAWLTLLIVAVVLYVFRKIYSEVVGALPLNGGAYNALLNTTNKSTASVAATLTLLSYMATSVISANEAMYYLSDLLPSMNNTIVIGSGSISIIILATIILLGVFASLAIMGISESSKVAVVIFIFHLSALAILAIAIVIFLFINGFEIFFNNWNYPMEGSISMAIFFGFSASMLGISGFESSANFVEEQKKGVFRKTLRNMWVIVSIINPLMAFFALSLIPIPEIKEHYSTTLLSKMGSEAAGGWLATIISVDAVLVLSGAVLTSFVGVSGLLERMTLDRIMPRFFLKKNQRGSSYRIIIMFFLLSVSVLLITKGKVELLAGVYTISFLSVMGLFAIGNILLKIRRANLPRPERASWISLLVGLAGVSVALIGNILMKPDSPDSPTNLGIFLDYFIPAIAFVFFMLNRVRILNLLLKVVQYLFNGIRQWFFAIDRTIVKLIHEINDQEFVFFTKGDNLSSLNKVILYILRNEQTRKLKVIKVCEDEEKLPARLLPDIDFLNREYPEIEIDFIAITGKFSPDFIHKYSQKSGIPINFMFIGSPHENFPYRIEDLGGVRLII